METCRGVSIMLTVKLTFVSELLGEIYSACSRFLCSLTGGKTSESDQAAL